VLSGTHITACIPPALVPLVRVGCQEVCTSVLKGFPDSQRFRSCALFVGRQVGGFVTLWDRCPRSGSFFGLSRVSDFSSGVDSSRASWCAGRAYCALLWTSCLGIGEPVVPRRVWISLVKLPEFLQTAYRKVVEGFFRPIFAFR